MVKKFLCTLMIGYGLLVTQGSYARVDWGYLESLAQGTNMARSLRRFAPKVTDLVDDLKRGVTRMETAEAGLMAGAYDNPFAQSMALDQIFEEIFRSLRESAEVISEFNNKFLKRASRADYEKIKDISDHVSNITGRARAAMSRMMQLFLLNLGQKRVVHQH